MARGSSSLARLLRPARPSFRSSSLDRCGRVNLQRRPWAVRSNRRTCVRRDFESVEHRQNILPRSVSQPDRDGPQIISDTGAQHFQVSLLAGPAMEKQLIPLLHGRVAQGKAFFGREIAVCQGITVNKRTRQLNVYSELAAHAKHDDSALFAVSEVEGQRAGVRNGGFAEVQRFQRDLRRLQSHMLTQQAPQRGSSANEAVAVDLKMEFFRPLQFFAC